MIYTNFSKLTLKPLAIKPLVIKALAIKPLAIKTFTIKAFTILSLLILLMYSQITIANSCGPIFPGALQTHAAAPDGNITFKCNSQIINNPDTILATNTVTNSGNNCAATCGSANCQASGQPAAALDVGNFQYNENGQNINFSQGESKILGSTGITDYAIINAKQGSSVTFVAQPNSTVYRIQRLDLGQGNTANLASGDYWIEDLRVGQGSNINVIGTSPVRIMLLNSTTIHQGGVNNSSETDAAKNLFIYSFSDFIINQGNTFKGYIYAKGDVLIRQGNIAAGAINAKNITIDQGANIYYDNAATTALDLNQVCNFTPTLSHFIIQHDGNGNYCIPEPITVKAYNNSTLVSNFNGIIKLDTGTGKGTWSVLTGHGTLEDTTLDDGIAYYHYAPEDNGQASFELLYTNGATSMNITANLRYNSNIHDDDSEGLLTFIANGFLITSAPIPTPTPAISDIVRYSTAQTAGISTPMYITAFGPTAALTCDVITSYTGAKNIKFWQNYLNPTSGTLTTAINGLNIGSNASQPIEIPLNFTNGTSSFTTLYRDVGMIQLSALDDSELDTANHIAGNTNNYVVKPARLAITNVPNNPAASSATSEVFTQAGDNFTVEVTVQDNDGNATPNYGHELIPARIQLLSSSLVAPTGGLNSSLNNGFIGNNTSFTRIAPGIFQGAEFYFDEVGIIKLKAIVADGNYLGTTDIESPESSNVGRFIPAYFAATANIPSFNSGCAAGAFTYLGQAITYNISPIITITAQSKLNNITQNYRDDFWKITPSNLTVTYNTNSAIAPLDSSNALNDLTVTQTTNGSGEITLGDGGGITFNKVANNNIAEFNAEIQANVTIQDADGVVYLANPYSIGAIQANTGIAFSHGNKILQGRISLSNNFGSELLPLTIPINLQYFNGSDYITNVTDQCTTIANPAYIQLTPQPNTLITTPTLTAVNNGIGQLTLSAPNQTGYLDIILDLTSAGYNLPYLQHDWPQNTSNQSFSDNPTARASFGIYHGKDKTIYLKEVLE